MAACDSCGDSSADVARLCKKCSALSQSFFVSAELDGRGGANEEDVVPEGVGPDPDGARSVGRATGAGENGGREEAILKASVRFGPKTSLPSLREGYPGKVYWEQSQVANSLLAVPVWTISGWHFVECVTFLCSGLAFCRMTGI